MLNHLSMVTAAALTVIKIVSGNTTATTSTLQVIGNR